MNMKKLLLILFLVTPLFSQTRWIEPRADEEGRIGSPSYRWGSMFMDSTWIFVKTYIGSKANMHLGADGRVYVSTDTTGSGGGNDTSLVADYYRLGFIKKRYIDSVGTIIKGDWNATAIDTAYASSVAHITASTAITATRYNTKDFQIKADTTFASTFYNNGFIKKSNIDSVGTLIKGGIGSGFTSIDTAYTNAVSKLTSSNTYAVIGGGGKASDVKIDTSKSASTTVSGFMSYADKISLGKKADSATFAGTANIKTLGTITTGVWNGTIIDTSYLGAIREVTAKTFVTATRYNTYDMQLSLDTTGASGLRSKYIPYVGANTAVDLGAQSITTTGAITASGLMTLGTGGTTQAHQISSASANALTLFRPQATVGAASGLSFSGNTSNSTQVSYSVIQGLVQSPSNSLQSGGIIFATRKSATEIKALMIDSLQNLF